MPAYRYRAVDFAGRIAQGSIAAANEWELAQNLNQSGLELIEARAKKDVAPQRLRLRRSKKISPEALTHFSSQMTDLLRAGIPFSESLQDLARAGQSGSLRDALDDIHRAINHGSMISEAFARHPRQFPEIFTAILTAGEKSGDMAATFAQLTRYAEARARMINQMRRAARYPLFLLLISFGVVTFMMTMVIPPIIQFLNSIDSQLPLMTRILIAVSDAVASYWWVFALAVLATGGLMHFIRRHSAAAAYVIDRIFLRVPLIGLVMHKLALARFAHSFSILFQSGIGVIESLRGAGVTLGNRALTADLADTERQVLAGRALSAALTGIFPPFAVHMIRVGERSGKLNKALDDIATAADRDAADVIEKLTGAMEPALTLLIGIILAWIVLAVLGPIYGNIAKIGGMM